jgi:hypothetical protein
MWINGGNHGGDLNLPNDPSKLRWSENKWRNLLEELYTDKRYFDYMTSKFKSIVIYCSPILWVLWYRVFICSFSQFSPALISDHSWGFFFLWTRWRGGRSFNLGSSKYRGSSTSSLPVHVLTFAFLIERKLFSDKEGLFPPNTDAETPPPAFFFFWKGNFFQFLWWEWFN